MSLTRRSFVKKSAYSAAAVTVLGTGIGFGQGESGNTQEIDKIEITVGKTVTVDGEGSGTKAEALARAILDVQLKLAIATLANPHNQVISRKSVPEGHGLKKIETSNLPPNPNDNAVVTVNKHEKQGSIWICEVRIVMFLGNTTLQTYTYGP